MPTATAEQTTMFPELDMDKPEQKKLFAAAKRLYALKSERSQLLTTSKVKVDEQEQKVIDLMHEAKIPKFRYENVEASLIARAEKVDVKLNVEEEDEEEDDDE